MNNHKITKVLIANRGEIALRIQRACDKLKIKYLSICSEADKESLFARKAQELAVIGPPAAKESYLAGDKIIEAAKKHGCDAVHPGYGFLSENADFAGSVEKAGLIFIGPSSASISALGSKSKARELARLADVPTTPGSAGGLADADLIKAANEIGYPVLLKAIAGGGGRGMRLAQSASELEVALPLARAEAKKNFGSENVYLEKFIIKPRHVEVQIFGDKQGNLIHLGTRDCSCQRRHQKLVEEAPAPALSPQLRESLHRCALAVAAQAGYYNAGTAEFLVVEDSFYFLEMNTRIQVEHPVTECVTGLDLVELQLKVAAGEPLGIAQSDVRFSGHAIEYRIYAEDPWKGFLPATGQITKLVRPSGEGIREDFGYEEGDKVPPYYDAMLSKLVVHASDRGACIAKSRDILRSYVLRGVPSSIDYHQWLLYNNSFRASPVDISWVEREFGPHRLKELRACLVRDPLHKEPVVRAEAKDFFEYTSQKYNTKYTIEVLHRKDGFFVASPVDSKGHRAGTHSSRMSNGLQSAVRSLIDDVLEASSPKEIFGEQ